MAERPREVWDGSPDRFRVGALWVATAVVILGLGACARAGFSPSAHDGGVSETRDGRSFDALGDDGLGDDGAAPLDGAGPDQPALDWGGTVMPAMWRRIPAGTFEMSSPADESCRHSNEGGGQHTVTLTRDFDLQSTEVTQAQFETLMGYNPSNFSAGGGGTECGENCPVESLSWHEAVAYCNALSIEAGMVTCYECTGSGEGVSCETKSAYAGSAFYSCPAYRLPTEAEWEYAYRAGTTTAYFGGANDDQCEECSALDTSLAGFAWYCANSGRTTHPVARKQPNAWGLYDMAGNVWEWCQDWDGSYPTGSVSDPTGPSSGLNRMTRGGGWVDYPRYHRAAVRKANSPRGGYTGLGFRCARTR